ncbi:VanZ family protein [Chthonobacter rhizosphaerae]|uniref:VanZ family protein n=1 Tax=Chthonobacter rhizosphaerae TaxID=2735553 RepID=UPI0015EEB607|nr:VanZ family protein [Chthonobacter rhizosphaerae]
MSRRPLVITTEQLTATLVLTGLGLFGLLAGLLGTLGVTEPFDKVIHAAFFLAMAATLFFVVGRRALLASVLAFVVGVFGEMAQSLTNVHTVSVLDVAANAAGIAVFLLAASPTTHARRHWRARRERRILAHVYRRGSHRGGYAR